MYKVNGGPVHFVHGIKIAPATKVNRVQFHKNMSEPKPPPDEL